MYGKRNEVNYVFFAFKSSNTILSQTVKQIWTTFIVARHLRCLPYYNDSMVRDFMIGRYDKRNLLNLCFIHSRIWIGIIELKNHWYFPTSDSCSEIDLVSSQVNRQRAPHQTRGKRVFDKPLARARIPTVVLAFALTTVVYLRSRSLWGFLHGYRRSCFQVSEH